MTETYYNAIRQRLSALFAAPLDEHKYFTEKYGHLIDGTEQENIEAFLRSDFSFDEAVSKIDSLNATIQEITNLASVREFDLVKFRVLKLIEPKSFNFIN